MMSLFSCCLLFFSLGKGILPWSLVGILLAYLVTKSPRILHFSEECMGTWTRQVFNLLVGLYTYLFLRLPALSPFSGRVLDEAASLLFAFCDQHSHTLYVGLFWVRPDFAERLKYCPNHLPKICPQDDLVKYTFQDVECSL